MNQVFDYKTTGLISGLMLGSHKSRQRGTGSDFYKKSLFLDEPDTSRLDLNASLTDPFESLHVKSYRQRSKIDVILLIDGSSSMLYGNKAALVRSVYDSINVSVEATNDRFSCYLLKEKRVKLDDADALTTELSKLKPESNQAEATQEVFPILPSKPALVFLISDFHWPETQLQSLLTILSAHLVVPIVLWQSKEFLDFPLWRFVELTDLETGASSLVFITRDQKQKIQQQYEDRKNYLTQQFRRFNQHPFWLIDDYDARQMSRYFSMQ
jgi:uncharacterized protein (DUF58 family)